MRKTINVDDLPEFDPAQYLDNEESIAVYLTGILEANNPACWPRRWVTLPAHAA